MIKHLTKRSVDALESRATRYVVHDDAVPGLEVRVSPDGLKVFGLQYRGVSGRRRFPIGRYGEITADEARKLALAARAQIAKGADPAAQRDASRTAPTVAALGADFLADVDARRKPVTAREYRRQWEKDILPALGAKRVVDVATADVTKLHRALRKRGPYIANRVVALLAAFFTFAIRQGTRLKGTNPAQGMEPFREAARERFLTPAEIAAIGEALTRAEQEGLPPAPRRRRLRKTGKTAKHRPVSADTPRPADPYAVGVLRFLLLSGWREQEAMQLRWDAIDVARGLATLDDTKTGRSQRMLGAPALLLLSELPRVEGSPFVFPGRTPDRPLADARRVWEAARHAAGLTDVRLHDLRHSYASIHASGGGSLLVLGKILGHRDAKSTQRYAHLFESAIKAGADQTAGEIAAALRGKDAASSSVPVSLRRAQ